MKWDFRYFIIAPIFLVLLLESGCAELGGTHFKRSYVSIKDKDSKRTVGTMLVWEADASAAILLPGGKACMQTALAVKTNDIKANAKVSEAVLNFSKAASAVAEKNSSNAPQSLASIAGSIKQTAQLLTTTTERTAFLNMGMFYICQISANKSIDGPQTAELVAELIKASAITGKEGKGGD